jgi:hypothetical protein
MAIIYTYPTKATLALADKVLISDSADANKTKNATITSIKDAIDVVDSITATLPLEATPSTGAVTISSRAYGGGATTGFVPSGGTSGNYLDGAGTWSTIDLTTDVNGILPAENGGLGGGVFNNGDLLYYSGASFARLATNGVTDNYVLTAVSGVPTWAFNPGGGSGPGTGTQYNLPIWSTTSTLGDSLITQNALGTVLSVGSNIASFSTTAGVGSVFATQVSVNGYSTFGGKLKLGSPDGATPVIIEGPANGGSAYTLKLPSSAPNNNQILEYTTSGNLGWINTPTGSGGISFSGSTVSGIATFASTSSATVNSEVKLLADGQMTFDGSSGNTGIKFDSSTNSDVLVADTTQFQQGLKFGASGETLDSYEEGSWTPTMFGAGSPTVTATGQYVKIGRNVTVWFSLVCTAGDTLAVARISGLPFNGQGASVYGHNGGASLSVNIGNSASVRYVTGTSGGATTLDLKVFTTSSITLNGPLPETENIDYQYSVGYWPVSQGNFTVRGTYTYKSQS